jgi:tRNA(Ile2) C34 agmatinyltransferase TiaS
MRTQEQINNLRRVFCGIYTPFAALWPDYTVELMADKIQTEINKTSKWTWEIRVLTTPNYEKAWSDIEPEPKLPCCTLGAIKISCEKLLQKYPAIVAILVVAKENSKLIFQFSPR